MSERGDARDCKAPAYHSLASSHSPVADRLLACILLLTQLVGSQRVHLRPPPPTSHMCLAPTPCPPPPRPPPPSICCRVRGCSTEVRASVRRDLVLKERDLVYQEAKETYSYMSHLDMFPVLAIPPAPREAPRAIFVQTLVCGIGP